MKLPQHVTETVEAEAGINCTYLSRTGRPCIGSILLVSLMVFSCGAVLEHTNRHPAHRNSPKTNPIRLSDFPMGVVGFGRSHVAGS